MTVGANDESHHHTGTHNGQASQLPSASAMTRTTTVSPADDLLDIERALASRLQGHRDYLTSITAAASAQTLDQPQEQDKTSFVSDGSRDNATDSAQALHSTSATSRPATETSLPHNHDNASMAPPAQAATQPVTLDGQNAEEQQLEPDVRLQPAIIAYRPSARAIHERSKV